MGDAPPHWVVRAPPAAVVLALSVDVSDDAVADPARARTRPFAVSAMTGEVLFNGEVAPTLGNARSSAEVVSVPLVRHGTMRRRP